MKMSRYFILALVRHGEEYPFLEVCNHKEHETLTQARECWYETPMEVRNTIMLYCRSHNCRVVVWETECIDRVHSISDA